MGVLQVDVWPLFTAGQAGVEDLDWRFPSDRFSFMDYFVDIPRRIDYCVPNLSCSFQQQTLVALGLTT
jgi:hypothetical protein